VVCDKSPRALEPFAASGCRIAGTPADCASQDAVIVMVASDEQVNDVVMGAQGVLAAVDPQKPPRLAILTGLLFRLHMAVRVC